MNVFHKVTVESLKKNRVRTIVTIVGIILSAAMICAVTTFASSFYNYIGEYYKYVYGDWHGSAERVEWQTFTTAWGTAGIEEATYNQILGYANVNSENEFKPYLYIIGGEPEAFVKKMPVHLLSGREPKDSTEIILPEHLETNGDVKYSLGDTITLEIGERMLDGYALTQNNPCYLHDEKGNEIPNGETLQIKETRTYTVVGFYERLHYKLEEYTAPGYTAITVVDKEWTGDYRFDVYFKMEKPKEIYNFIKEYNIEGQVNTDLLMLHGVSTYNSVGVVLSSLAAIVIALIMFGSISLIYNAFSISVSERTKQFGLLSSVGATKKQLRKMVLYEAVVVSSIGIPLGVLSGIAGIGVTLNIIGDKFKSFGFPMDMKLSVSGISIVIAVIVAFVTVLLSAWIPSKRAMRVSAVEAIRQNMDIHAKSKDVKTSKLVYKLFGLPGMLANKHYKRSKKKYRATVVSLFMSILLFVSASAFTDYLMAAAVDGISPYEYDFTFYSEMEDFNQFIQEELLEELKACKAITDVVYQQGLGSTGYVANENLTKEYVAVADEHVDGPTTKDGTHTGVFTSISFVNDAEFRNLLKQYRLDEKEYMNPDAPLAIAIDDNQFFDSEKGQYLHVDVIKGNEVEVSVELQRDFEGYNLDEVYEDKDGEPTYCYINVETGEKMDLSLQDTQREYTLKAGKVLREEPYYERDVWNCQLKLLYPQSMKAIVLPEIDMNDSTYTYYMKSENPSESRNEVKTLLSDRGINANNFNDYAEAEEENRNIVTLIQVFAYGFIILISLIAAANVFNTISTNISLRRREFAMLKSVGMTSKGFNRMMNFECLLYGSRALLYGLPASVGVTYLIYLAMAAGYDAGFRLPWAAIGIAVLSVFLVVFVTMMYSMSKIKKDNPIDALKNENL